MLTPKILVEELPSASYAPAPQLGDNLRHFAPLSVHGNILYTNVSKYSVRRHQCPDLRLLLRISRRDAALSFSLHGSQLCCGRESLLKQQRRA
jgi:hypothetical protein